MWINVFTWQLNRESKKLSLWEGGGLERWGGLLNCCPTGLAYLLLRPSLNQNSFVYSNTMYNSYPIKTALI